MMGAWLALLSTLTSLVVVIGSLIVYSVPNSRGHHGHDTPVPTTITIPPPSPAAVKPATFFANSSPTGREWTPRGVQAFRGGAAWKDTQPSVETRGARSNPQVINPSLVVNGKYASWPSLASVRGHVGEPTRAQSTITGIKPGHHLETLAIAAADLCGVDQDLAWSLALRESSGRHWGPDGRVLKSSSSAWGLYQIKLATARDVDPSLDIMQPWGNALAGLCHFRRLLDKAKGRGGERLALRWYHRGEYARGPVPQATHDYINDIMEAAND